MPIITQAKVKTLLQIETTNTTYDDLIDELIPIVQYVIYKQEKIKPQELELSFLVYLC